MNLHVQIKIKIKKIKNFSTFMFILKHDIFIITNIRLTIFRPITE